MYHGACRVLVALRHCSYAFMYCFQNLRSSMFAVLNFQFLSGESMRSRNRYRSTIERYRFFHTFPSLSIRSPSLRRISG